MTGEKEILWEEIDSAVFRNMMRQIYSHTRVFISGINFSCRALKINVQYDNPEFRELLEEKFNLSEPYPNVPCLTFVRHKKAFGFRLPCKQYGYVSNNKKSVLVFASSFGVFKSVISGYASLCLEQYGYVPIHGSVFSMGQRGLILTGGTLAGKTTILLKLVEVAMKGGEDVKILTDDWAIVLAESTVYIAKTFDHSVSLREQNLVENPSFSFYRHDHLVKVIHERNKVSIKPENLYGVPIGTDQIKVDVIVLLIPQPGPANPRYVDADEFAGKVIDAAYHYPYISQSQIEVHRTFWKQAVSKLEVVAFSTRSMTGGFQNIDEIRRLVM